MSVSVNSPRTPVTSGSKGIAAATLPNVCKMPGPPAPFVPTPLPNFGRSGDSPKGYSKQVTIEGEQVAIRGATFKSTGDIASKATGGGVVSSNTHGPTRFIGPGATNVKIEGKSVHLLGEPMLNNCGPSGSPANSATMLGLIQRSGLVAAVRRRQCPLCHKNHGRLAETKKTKADAKALADNFATELDKAITAARNAAVSADANAAAARDAANAAAAAKRATMAQTPERLAANSVYNAAKQAAEAAQRAAKQAATALEFAENVTTMLGVAVCVCDKKYANQSGRKFIELCDAAFKASMKHPPDVKNSYKNTPKLQALPIPPPIAALTAHMEKIGKMDILNNAETDSKRFNATKTGPAAFPPGHCAAQGALLHLMEDRALPLAMTEQWFSVQKKATAGEIRYHDSATNKSVDRTFGHGESVPPCTTCVVLLPFLLCTDGKTQCNHKT